MIDMGLYRRFYRQKRRSFTGAGDGAICGATTLSTSLSIVMHLTCPSYQVLWGTSSRLDRKDYEFIECMRVGLTSIRMSPRGMTNDSGSTSAVARSTDFPRDVTNSSAESLGRWVR